MEVVERWLLLQFALDDLDGVNAGHLGQLLGHARWHLPSVRADAIELSSDDLLANS